MFQMIRKYCVFTNRIGYYSKTDTMCYLVTVVTPSTSMSIYIGNAIVGWRDLTFNLG